MGTIVHSQRYKEEARDFSRRSITSWEYCWARDSRNFIQCHLSVGSRVNNPTLLRSV